MADVELEPVTLPEGGRDRLAALLVDLPRVAAYRAVEVAVAHGGQDVELLAAIGAVAVADEAELLEDVERAVDGRRGGRGVPRPAALDELGAGDVTVRRGEHLDDGLALWRPAQTALPQQAVDRLP